MNGDKTIDIEVNTEFTDPGVEVVGILGEILSYEVEGTADTTVLGEHDDLYIYFYFSSQTDYVHDFQIRIYDSISNDHILTYDYYWGPPIRTLTAYDVEADTYISEITVCSQSFDDPSLFLNLFDYLSEGYYHVEFYSESGTSLGGINGENMEEADILYALSEAYLFDYYDIDYYYEHPYYND